MKHLILKYYPSLNTIILALFSLICGGIAYNNNSILTDFEVILIVICTFIGLKGIINFIKNIWL